MKVMKYSIVLFFMGLLFFSCNSHRKLLLDENLTKLCNNGEGYNVEVIYDGEPFSPKALIEEVTKKNEIVLSFRGFPEDLLAEVYIDNRLIKKDTIYASKDSVKTGGSNHFLGMEIKYNYSKHKTFPILTIKNVGEKDDCFQTVLDIRFNYVRIYRGREYDCAYWIITYSNDPYIGIM